LLSVRTKPELIAAVDKWLRYYNQRGRSAIVMRSPNTYEHTENAAQVGV
jgi:hypothetical protein